MPQVSFYIDEETLRKVETAAKMARLSISKWVMEQIRSRVGPVYPEGFESLFGSVDTGDLIRPEELPDEHDSAREAL
jgi:hypothetical protein